MTSFATLDTPGGFPVPAIPKMTDSRKWPKNCQESDVDECVSNIILQKDWTAKVYDDNAIQEWSTEGWSCSKKDQGKGVLRYAVEECCWRQQEWQQRVGTPVAICKTGLVLSKDNVSQELRSSIMEDIRALRREEENAKSTMALHPKYTKLLHLVHPSLYAYEKGVTHVLPEVGAEAVSAPAWDSFLGIRGIPNIDEPVRPDTEGLRSDSLYGNSYHRFDTEPPTAAECSQFQWLPSEFLVSSPSINDDQDSKMTKSKCLINSYINNLHPIKYRSLYDKIGELFVEALPLMEEVLSEVNDDGKVRKQLSRFDSKTRPKQYHWRSKPKKEPSVEPPIPEFSPPKYSAEKTVVNLHGRPLQVFVKLITMGLEPEEEVDFKSMTREQRSEYFVNYDPPDYFAKGHWHVEGTHDERIVASACCYLGAENVLEGGLYFRDGSVGSGGMELGTAETFPGRILVWPNYLHHKTGTVSLVDKTQPGERVLCCFHLVDPTLRIRSTATVPPQQQSWLSHMVDELALSSFQVDDLVRSKIHTSMVKDGSTISYDEALNRRKRLSEERAADYNVLSKNFWIPCD